VEVAGVMLRLGCTAFGGPAAHVAMLREEVVRRREWLSEQQFLDLLGASGLLPGPTSTQTVLHVGRARAGILGLWVAGICFITPAVLLTAGFAWAYVRFGALPSAQGLLYGVKPAVLAVIFAAIAQLARSAVKTAALGAVTAAVLLGFLVGGSEIALLLGSGAVGMLLARPWRKLPVAAYALVGLPAGLGAAAPTLGNLFLYFLKIGCFLFGGGYVLFAFLRQGLVHDYGWLTDQQLVDAIAVGQFTPGPLFSSAAFVGYLVGGWPGAVVASLGIFLPSFVLVWATHPLVRRMRGAVWSAGFLDGVNAGSIGLMAGVLAQLGRSSLVGWPAWVILGAAGAAVLRWRVNSAWVVLGGALLGLILHRLG
jgi:chromate transporter